MKKKKKAELPDDMRLNPEERVASRFDSASIAKYPLAEDERVGVQVLDNCAEEHIQ